MSDRPVSDMEAELRLKAEAELEYRERITVDYKTFVEHVKPENRWYRHNTKFGQVLEDVAAGKIKRLMVFSPPSSWKSENVSRLFPAYLIRKDAKKRVGLASYSADLAHNLSRDALDNYVVSGGAVDQDVSGAREWRTLEGGGMWAAGAGGPATGKHADVLIIDDPLKNLEEAYSPTIRDKLKNWWRTVWYKRQRMGELSENSGAAFIVVQTRWHPDDLSGWLLEEEKLNPQHWTILNFPELMEGVWKFPATCNVIPDWREQGEVLIPELMTRAMVEQNRKMMTEKFWQALCQQRPTKVEGDLWKEDWFKPFDAEQLALDSIILTAVGYDWDLAYTEDEKNSACAYVKSGIHQWRDADGRQHKKMYVLEFDFRWVEFPELIDWMSSKGGPHYIEAKASGKSAKQVLTHNDVPATEVEIAGGGDKRTRAMFASPAVERGDVFVARHLKERLLNDPRQGLLLFPASGTDVNDAFVQAINRHFKGGILSARDLKDVSIVESVTSQATEQY